MKMKIFLLCLAFLTANSALANPDKRCHFARGMEIGDTDRCRCFDKDFDPKISYCDGASTKPYNVDVPIKSQKIDARELAMQLQVNLQASSLRLEEVSFDNSIAANLMSFFGKGKMAAKFSFEKDGKKFSGLCYGEDKTNTRVEFCTTNSKKCTFTDDSGKNVTTSFGLKDVISCAYLDYLNEISASDTPPPVKAEGMTRKSNPLSGTVFGGDGTLTPGVGDAQ
jgi:hypothetical protein